MKLKAQKLQVIDDLGNDLLADVMHNLKTDPIERCAIQSDF